MSLSVGASSDPLSYLQTLLQQGTTAASNAANASDPLSALFQSAAGNGSVTNASTTNDTQDGSGRNTYDLLTMSTLLSAQGQSNDGTQRSILFNQINDADTLRRADDRHLPDSTSATSQDGCAGRQSANSLTAAAGADGATVQTETNPDGSITTVTTYPDGSTATSTTAALPDSGGTTDAGSGNPGNSKLAAQWTQLQSQLLSVATSTLSLLV